MGAGQSARGEEGAAGAALAALKTGTRASPGAGDRSGWESAAATALERLLGIAILGIRQIEMPELLHSSMT